ncbi:MAG: GrpB family protein [Actinomycetes bacterium]
MTTPSAPGDSSMIHIADYDDEWPARFAILRDELSATLTTMGVPFLAIEHVGSTSVPGLAAKPIIDCDIVVTAESVPSASAALVAAGFEALGDLGVPLRWAFIPPPHLARTNVYVTVQGSVSLRNHLAVRDVLRRRPDLRDMYADAKRRAADVAADLDDYTKRKSDVLQEILRVGGLSAEERAAILSLNSD